MLDVFVSYSHKDDEFRERLEVQLALLKRQGVIRVWHDRRIGAGKDIHCEISEHLERADIVLLLVSPDFLASDYCYEREMARAMQRHEEGSARVIPVILRVCDWQSAPFGRLKAVPRDGKPITKFTDRDEGFNEVSAALRSVAAELAVEDSTAKTPAHGNSEPAEAKRIPPPHPGGVRLRRAFTDLDRDGFIEEAFEFIAARFKDSLVELKAANPGIETNYRRIDANHFSAKVYVAGKEAAHCRIWFGGSTHALGGIMFSLSDIGDTSFNESLSVTDDGYSLFLKPTLGMAFRPGMSKEHMTWQEAANYYWSMLIEPLRR